MYVVTYLLFSLCGIVFFALVFIWDNTKETGTEKYWYSESYRSGLGQQEIYVYKMVNEMQTLHFTTIKLNTCKVRIGVWFFSIYIHKKLAIKTLNCVNFLHNWWELTVYCGLQSTGWNIFHGNLNCIFFFAKIFFRCTAWGQNSGFMSL